MTESGPGMDLNIKQKELPPLTLEQAVKNRAEEFAKTHELSEATKEALLKEWDLTVRFVSVHNFRDAASFVSTLDNRFFGTPKLCITEIKTRFMMLAKMIAEGGLS